MRDGSRERGPAGKVMYVPLGIINPSGKIIVSLAIRWTLTIIRGVS